MKNKFKTLVLAGLASLAGAGCDDDGRLRMESYECPGQYWEQGHDSKGNFNYVLLRENVAGILSLKDYTNRAVNWQEDGARRNLSTDRIDEMTIKRNLSFNETITPADSNSRTIEGRRARDWLIKGNNLYLQTRQCFVDWARRDYRKNHLFAGGSK